MTERERLIELINKSNISFENFPVGNAGDKARIELADYLIENGVIVPPVKVGDTIYKLGYTTCKNGESYPDSYGCCGCEDECDMERTIVERKVPTREFIVGALMDGVGTSIYYFLTREEAEKALNEQKK